MRAFCLALFAFSCEEVFAVEPSFECLALGCIHGSPVRSHAVACPTLYGFMTHKKKASPPPPPPPLLSRIHQTPALPRPVTTVQSTEVVGVLPSYKTTLPHQFTSTATNRIRFQAKGTALGLEWGPISRTCCALQSVWGPGPTKPHFVKELGAGGGGGLFRLGAFGLGQGWVRGGGPNLDD